MYMCNVNAVVIFGLLCISPFISFFKYYAIETLSIAKKFKQIVMGDINMPSIYWRLNFVYKYDV